MNGDVSSPRAKWLAGLCWLQAGAATVAALATFAYVESIVGFGPAIAALGLVLAFLSLTNASLNLLLFGLSCPLATSLIALLIASLNWSPDQATIPVRVMLTLNAGVTVGWGAWTSRQIMRPSPVGSRGVNPRFHFSLFGLLGAVTFACALFALVRQLHGAGEMMWFAVYGIGVLLLICAVSLWFWHRVKRRTSAR